MAGPGASIPCEMEKEVEAIVLAVLLAVQAVTTILSEQDESSSRNVLHSAPLCVDEEDIDLEVLAVQRLKMDALVSERRNSRLQGDYYIKPRQLYWWDTIVNEMDEERWRGSFRLPKPVFMEFVDSIRDRITMHPPASIVEKIPCRLISPEKQLAIVCYRLAHGISAVQIGELFGCSKRTVMDVLERVMTALVDKLQKDILKWPEGDTAVRVMKGFEDKQGMQNCMGAIDCTHVPFQKPAGQPGTIWYDRTGRYSMVLQAIVDCDMRFINTHVGWAGSTHDSRIYKASGHYEQVLNAERLNGPAVNNGGVDIPQYIVGDAGYPLEKNLLTPFPGHGLTQVKENYNFRHSSTRMVVERSFGLLKGQWRILQMKMTKPDIAEVVMLVTVCCIFHNAMIDSGLHFEEHDFHVEDHADWQGGEQGGGREALIRNAVAEYLAEVHNFEG